MRRSYFTIIAIAVGLGLAGCSVTGADSQSSADGHESITLVTHESFTPSEGVLEAFTDQTGIAVEIVAPGDAGTLVNQLVLTKQSPLGDVAFGVDNTFASRALDEGVFESYEPSELPASAEQYVLSDALTPIDVSDVCLNIDTTWYAEQGQTPPNTLEDLTKPEYAGQLVVSNPATSSPGLAMLLTTIGAFGSDGYLAYWAELRANDLLVVDSWSDAYYVDFTAGGGDGTRPIVLSYSSSPPYTVQDGEPTTEALLETCFRQVEYAGVLSGAANPEGAQQFIDFLISEQFQSDLPAMYVYPVDDSVALPEDWAQWAPMAERPFEVPAADIAENRAAWITDWTETVVE